MSELTNVISAIGFPIVSFLISAYFIKYSYDKQLEKDKEADERSESHWQQISDLTTAVNNNTEVLRELVRHSLGGDPKND